MLAEEWQKQARGGPTFFWAAISGEDSTLPNHTPREWKRNKESTLKNTPDRRRSEGGKRKGE